MKYSLIMCSNMHMDIDKANVLFRENRYIDWVSDYTKADVVIIMTCAFGNKKEYSMFVIADAIKNAKSNARIIATGCLAKINGAELKAIPNLEVKSFEEVLEIISKAPKTLQEQKDFEIKQNTVIISNGCLKRCSYCVYPLLEKKYSSKPMEQVLLEVKKLYETEPIIYISGAHETSDYGVDIYGHRAFAELLDKICTRFPNCKYVIGWFHPDGLTDETIEVIARYKNIVQIMVHIQHVDPELLKAMKRPRFEKTEQRIQKLHRIRPDLEISTEVIVGFPGETLEKFNALVDYLEQMRDVFTDIGVASFEPVIGTEAGCLKGLLSPKVRLERMEIIKSKFNATGYSAPEDFKPLLSSFFEACFLLSRLK